MKVYTFIGMLIVGIAMGSFHALALQMDTGAVVEEISEDGELVVETNTGERKHFLIADDTVFPGSSVAEIKEGVSVIVESDGKKAIAVNKQR